MNPAFLILVLIGAISAWNMSRPFWEPMGKWICKRQEKIMDTLNVDEEKENEE